MKKESAYNTEFQDIIKDIIENPVVQKMKEYRQHFDIDCFRHCYNVAYCCYNLCKKMDLDYVSATRAAMLHDFFLYDWRKKGTHKSLHAFHHGRTAYENASKIFDINKKEKDMIIKHMWPTTPMPPRYREGYILTIVDKYCALKETFEYVLESHTKSTAKKINI